MPRFLASAVLALIVAAAAGSSAGAAEHLRVAFVAEPSGVGFPIVQQHLAGLRRAADDFGVEVTVVVQPVRTSWTSTFEALARRRYDLVIAAFPSQAPAVLAAARAYPDQRFVLGDTRTAEWTRLGFGPSPPNVQGLSAREEEIGFVVGYLAGLVERRRPGRDIVGSVGGAAVVPAVARFIAGFRAGARRASPSIRRLNGYSFSFGDPERCKRIAEAQIAKGAGVVFNVAGFCGLGTLAAVRKHGVWGIGVDQDQSALGPHIVTSAVKDLGLMMYRTIELLARERLETGSDTTFGLREGVLRLGRVSPRVPRSVLERTRRIERAIVSGRITGIPTTVGN